MSLTAADRSSSNPRDAKRTTHSKGKGKSARASHYKGANSQSSGQKEKSSLTRSKNQAVKHPIVAGDRSAHVKNKLSIEARSDNADATSQITSSQKRA